ncbi:hypothetical protein GCM10009606_07710 [Nocardioides aquiterrae]|uniref:Uncharacterized protein n=1 Tax=Nocardioides aquiterrae TaxID=203799 RepID=A0ABN1U9N6_9ACTN
MVSRFAMVTNWLSGKGAGAEDWGCDVDFASGATGLIHPHGGDGECDAGVGVDQGVGGPEIPCADLLGGEAGVSGGVGHGSSFGWAGGGPDSGLGPPPEELG